MQYVIRFMLTQVASIALAVLWMAFGIEGAGNILRVWIWVVLALSVVVVWKSPDPDWRNAVRWRMAVDAVVSVSIGLALIWFGHMMTGMAAIGAVLMFATARKISTQSPT